MTYGVTDHAVKRYIERFKPNLEPRQARRELVALSQLVEPLPEKPGWIRGESEADRWLELATNVVAAVQDTSITTIFARSGISREHREEKKARKKRKQAERQVRNSRNHVDRGRRRERSRSWT